MRERYRAQKVAEAKKRADKIREIGKDSGKPGALPPQPKPEKKRNYLTQDGWKQK